jgi:hypothetical protein
MAKLCSEDSMSVGQDAALLAGDVTNDESPRLGDELSP